MAASAPSFSGPGKYRSTQTDWCYLWCFLNVTQGDALFPCLSAWSTITWPHFCGTEVNMEPNAARHHLLSPTSAVGLRREQRDVSQNLHLSAPHHSCCHLPTSAIDPIWVTDYARTGQTPSQSHKRHGSLTQSMTFRPDEKEAHMSNRERKRVMQREREWGIERNNAGEVSSGEYIHTEDLTNRPALPHPCSLSPSIALMHSLSCTLICLIFTAWCCCWGYETSNTRINTCAHSCT